MRRSLLAAVALLAATTSLALAAPDQAADERAIRAIPQQIAAGWNRGSGKMIGDVYAIDGTLVAGEGTVTSGRDEIGAYHQRQFDNFLKDTQLIVQVTSVRFLAPDIALMRTAGGILWPGEQQLKPGNDGIQTFITVKRDGAWRVLHFQNTRVVPKK